MPILKAIVMVVKIAHRGVNEMAPENTIPAFKAAIDMGLDYVEIDIRCTKDAHLVLSHDETVDRVTDGSGKVSDLALDELKGLDAGSWFDDRFRGLSIPTFQEVLEVCEGHIGIYLDLKEAPLDPVLATLSRYGMIGDTVVYSDLDTLAKLKELEPGLRVMPGPGIWLRVPGIPAAIVNNLPAEVLDSNIVDWTPEAVEEVHGAGGEVYVDTLGEMDNQEGMLAALNMGVDGIDTDHPDILVKTLEEWEGA